MFEDEIKDGRLRLFFACCHPLIPQEAQIALALKTLCGFSPAEIAKAFLTSEAAIAKRLTRARQSIQEQKIPFEIPSGEELSPRLDGVLQTIYLLFNEGYKASSGDSLVRADLCHEAIRLANLLIDHSAADLPRTHALLSLMLLDSARLPARTDASGKILRLKEQDRSAWDKKLIHLGIQHLAQAAVGEDLSEYHLQAGIAAFHCTADDYESTNWKAILAQYDRWMLMTDSPIVALNRAVALSKVEGPKAGLAAVEAIANRKQLETYYLTYAVLGEFEAQLGRYEDATNHLRKALQMTELQSERSFLSKRLEEFDAQ
jgi:RNA polymerase sigma-70 factor (ECF subfamily)